MEDNLYKSNNKDSILKSFGPFTIVNSGTSIEGLYFSNDKYYLEEKNKFTELIINIKNYQKIT